MTKENFTRVNNDVNGNARYVFHFMELINDEEHKFAHTNGDILNGKSPIDIMYKIALKKAKQIGGRKFHNKQYSGGIVIQSCNLEFEIKKNQRIESKLIKQYITFLNQFLKNNMVTHFMYPACCGTAMSLPEPMTILKAKVWLRNWLNVERLPNGTEF